MTKSIWLRGSVFAGVGLALLAGALAAPQPIDEGNKPPHTIKEVMKVALKGDLVKKVVAGDASDDEKKNLLDLLVSLADNEPTKGDMQSWNALTSKAVMAAAKVVVGREGASDELKAATNCKACHDVHKPW